MTWTVFLDRDGTLNAKAPEGDYVKRPEELRLLPGAAGAVRALNDRGARVIVATNQRGVARGLMTRDDLDAVHRALAAELAREGAHLDAIYSCVHDHDSCECRKPGIGLFLQARDADPAIDFARSIMVGDAPSDIDAGRSAGMLTVAVGGRVVAADHVARDLAAAIPWIVRRLER